MSFVLKSPQEIMQDIAARAKAKRLEQKLTQQGLSVRSGVDIALALGCLENFEDLFKSGETPRSLFTSKTDKPRKRGTIK